MLKKILIVEDDVSLQKYLRELFLDNQYSIQIAADGASTLNIINKLPPDLVILDLGLPDMTGESILMEVKKKQPNLPMIILTAKVSMSDIVLGLNLGADDYMTKPFVAEELLARVKARLRQNGTVDNKQRVADLELDGERLEVIRGNKIIQLTPQEFKLLEYLMNNKGRVLTREMILNRVWSYPQDIETRVVDVYMGYLRKKLDQKFDKKLFHSIRGFGYMIKE